MRTTFAGRIPADGRGSATNASGAPSHGGAGYAEDDNAPSGLRGADARS